MAPVTVTVTLVPGDATLWAVDVRGRRYTGFLQPIEVSDWLDTLIRSIHRQGDRARVVVAKPPIPSLMADATARIVRRVLDVYDAVKAEWR